jgi:hypothetical protein
LEEDIKKLGEKIREEMRKESVLLKEPLIGFLAVTTRRNDGSYFVTTYPLGSSWDHFGEHVELEKNDEVIGVFPAPPYSYIISGLFPKDGENYPDTGTFELLGYEFDGADCPDWNTILKDAILKRKEKDI